MTVTFRTLALVCASAFAVGAPTTALAATQGDTTQFSVTAGSLTFSTAPTMPTLTGVTLNGSAQATNTTMTNFAVRDSTGSGDGWNVTVNGVSGAGKSAVFAEYCTGGSCGASGYVGSGETLSANSLVLNSTSASFTPGSAAPTHQCNSGCNVDSAAPVKTVSAAADNGLGTYTTTGWTASSLQLSTPANLKALDADEVYRVDLLWSLTSGP